MNTLPLENLSALLKNPEQWPAGFEWDYKHVSSCAVGLMCRAHNVRFYDLCEPGKAFTQSLADMLDMDIGNFHRIFVQANIVLDTIDVKPEMVARMIDQYLDIKKYHDELTSIYQGGLADVIARQIKAVREAVIQEIVSRSRVQVPPLRHIQPRTLDINTWLSSGTYNPTSIDEPVLRVLEEVE